jgi:hypothetical protein
MSDAISNAINAAKTSAVSTMSSTANTAASSAISAASAAVPPGATAAAEKLKKLPITKDPELLKQQAKAEAQKLAGEVQNKLQQEKDKKIEELKDKAVFLGPLLAAGVALYLKPPILDPKALATVAYLKAQKELRELKQKVSKDNLKKAKETFTFPMKPPTSLSGFPPKIPEIPTIPPLPTVPQIPKLPDLPKLP